MRATYTGSLQNSSGQLGFIENLPLKSVIQGGTAGTNPVNVAQLFNHATHTMRLGVDTTELVYQPAERNSEIFTNVDDGALEIGTLLVSESTMTQEASTLAPKVFGFVWQGLELNPGDLTKLSFELIKNSEWRPTASSGLPETPIVHLGPSKVGPSMTSLEMKAPGWTRRVMDSAGSMGGAIARAAFTGVSKFAGRALMGVGRQALSSAVPALKLLRM
jgi:hypothetical protein